MYVVGSPGHLHERRDDAIFRPTYALPGARYHEWFLQRVRRL